MSCERLRKINTMDLSKIHTKILLRMLRGLLHCFHEWEDDCSTCIKNDEREKARERIKNELSKREHVPNKKESKIIRKLRKKQGE